MTDKLTSQMQLAEALIADFHSKYDLVTLQATPVVGLSDVEVTELAVRAPGWYTAARMFFLLRDRSPAHVEAIMTGQRLGAHPHVRDRKKNGPHTVWLLDAQAV